MNVRQRIARVLLGDMRSLRWVMGWAGVMAGIGFCCASVENENYHLLNTLQPAWVWGCAFLAYGLIKLAGSLYHLPGWIRYGNGTAGLWLWSYLFLSFAVFDPTEMRATELMLAVPIVCETWLFSNAMHRDKLKKGAPDVA